LIEDILEYSEVKQCGGALIFLDFTKAFDSLNWEFLFYTLVKFNFGPIFKRCVKILYKNPKGFIKNNGYKIRNVFDTERY
jgi:hypothetical protein